MNKEQRKEADLRRSLKPYVRSAYDFQAERIRAFNRGMDKEGEAPKSYLTQEDKNRFLHWGETFESFEKEAFSRIEEVLNQFGVWRDFLSDVGGIGPAMGGVLVASFDPYRAPHPSNYWSYAGLAQGREATCNKCGGLTIITGDVARAACWKGRSIKSKGCGGKLTVTGRQVRQRKIEGEPLRYNAWLRTKMFVLAASFLRQQTRCEFTPMYYDYKHRIESEGRVSIGKDGKEKPWIPGHIDMASKRFMIKGFLLEFWRWDRAMLNLPLGESYQEAKLHHRHGSDLRETGM